MERHSRKMEIEDFRFALKELKEGSELLSHKFSSEFIFNSIKYKICKSLDHAIKTLVHQKELIISHLHSNPQITKIHSFCNKIKDFPSKIDKYEEKLDILEAEGKSEKQVDRQIRKMKIESTIMGREVSEVISILDLVQNFQFQFPFDLGQILSESIQNLSFTPNSAIPNPTKFYGFLSFTNNLYSYSKTTGRASISKVNFGQESLPFGFAACEKNKNIYISGGSQNSMGKNAENLVFSYKIGEGIFKLKPCLALPRCRHTMLCLQIPEASPRPPITQSHTLGDSEPAPTQNLPQSLSVQHLLSEEKKPIRKTPLTEIDNDTPIPLQSDLISESSLVSLHAAKKTSPTSILIVLGGQNNTNFIKRSELYLYPNQYSHHSHFTYNFKPKSKSKHSPHSKSKTPTKNTKKSPKEEDSRDLDSDSETEIEIEEVGRSDSFEMEFRKEWREGPMLNEYKCDIGACVFNPFYSSFSKGRGRVEGEQIGGVVYLFGGYCLNPQKRFSTIVEKMVVGRDVNAWEWKIVEVKTGEGHGVFSGGGKLGAVQLDKGNILVFGGCGNTGCQTSVYRFNVQVNGFVEAEKMPIYDEFSGNLVKNLGDTIVAFGIFYKKIYLYSIQKRKWKVVKDYDIE
jgi:hypothetical protein